MRHEVKILTKRGEKLAVDKSNWTTFKMLSRCMISFMMKWWQQMLPKNYPSLLTVTRKETKWKMLRVHFVKQEKLMQC